MHWERLDLVVPDEISRYWAKGAVIPRNPRREAVRIDGNFLMFLSEGCGNQQYIGYSRDLVKWAFKQQTYMTLPKQYGRIYEVACAITGHGPTGHRMVLDVYNHSPGGYRLYT